jgi:succinate dehydrogenase / fumarate reductase cytochrome b subunit
VKVLELGLVAAVLYHAINGVKVMIMDFWPSTTRYFRAMSLVSTGLFLISTAAVTVIMAPGILNDALGWNL